MAKECFARAVIVITAYKSHYGVTEHALQQVSDLYVKMAECFAREVNELSIPWVVTKL